MTSGIHLFTTTIAVFVALASPATAQQSEEQQKCINALNAGAAKMGQIQGKENVGCLSSAAKGKLTGSAQTCLGADTKGRVAMQQGKLAYAETKKCASAPTLAYTDAATVGSSARTGRLQAFADLFGADLDAAVIACDANRDACKCQGAVAKAAEKLAAAQWKSFNRCKKDALDAGAATAAAVAECVDDAGNAASLAADTGGKLQKIVDKLAYKIAKACDEPAVTAAAFADGDCSATSGAGLAACVGEHVSCRVCQTINDVDALEADCDGFDDGADNDSCGCSPLSTAACDDGVACTIGDACGGGTCSGTAIEPDRAAAITKQIVSTDEFDVNRLEVELVTVTRTPFQLDATGLAHPAGFDLESLVTTPCTLDETGLHPRFRCRHTAILVATSACQGDGAYQLSLQYSCSPDVAGCSLCGATDTIDFNLDTEFFCD
jgi:hypothetical protein